MNVECHYVPPVARKGMVRAASGFMRELRRVGPQIFHAHLNWPLGCRHELTLARLLGNCRTVATAHLFSGLKPGPSTAVKQFIQSKVVDRFIAVSGEVGVQLNTNLGVPSSRIAVVRNGIVIPRSSKPDARLRHEITGGFDRPIILTPARLHEQKGHVHLLEAARTIPDALFVFAGDGPLREELENTAHRFGVADRVRFLGQRNDIPELLAICDLFVLPSLYEGLPLSVLEAMAAGKPVIATNVGGTMEAVSHGDSGLLVPARDSAALSAAIRNLMENPDLADRLAQNGRARVLRDFSCDRMVEPVSDVYRELE